MSPLSVPSFESTTVATAEIYAQIKRRSAMARELGLKADSGAMIMGLLNGKVALVTGGTSGIGRASAVLFAKEGAKVALTGRRATEGEAVVAEIKAAGGEAIFIQADLAQTDSIPGIIAQVVERFGRLDCAFNNAGVSGVGPLDTLTESVWNNIVDTNLKGRSSASRPRQRR